MDKPAQILKELTSLGLSEQAIADRLKRRGVQVTQPTLNRIKRGEIKRPSYDVGAALLVLRDECIADDDAQRRRA